LTISLLLYVLIASCSTSTLQALELIADYARLKFGPGSYELTDTSTPAAERYSAVQRFNAASTAAQQQQQDTEMPAADEAGGSSSSGAAQAKQPFLFLMMPRSIGLGTDLPGLSAAIIYESDWHPRLDLQALHRYVVRWCCLQDLLQQDV
jgi:SNF2 family DNA or RNA helicase